MIFRRKAEPPEPAGLSMAYAGRDGRIHSINTRIARWKDRPIMDTRTAVFECLPLDTWLSYTEALERIERQLDDPPGSSRGHAQGLLHELTVGGYVKRRGGPAAPDVCRIAAECPPGQADPWTAALAKRPEPKPATFVHWGEQKEVSRIMTGSGATGITYSSPVHEEMNF